MTLLDVENLHVYYGQIHALKGITLHVDPGEIVTLIGANGAGKSTTLKTISGLLRPRQGRITLSGEDLAVLPARDVVAKGVVQVPEGRRIFGQLTVHENLLMGAYIRAERDGVESDLARVFTIFPRLKERRSQVAGSLSGGEQQMLAIGRGLMSQPKVLLLDEPSMGLAPVLVEQNSETITGSNRLGTTVLLVEQNAYMALHIAQRGYVLQTGEIALSGSAAELQANAEVRKAYLGG